MFLKYEVARVQARGNKVDFLKIIFLTPVGISGADRPTCPAVGADSRQDGLSAPIVYSIPAETKAIFFLNNIFELVSVAQGR